MSGSATIINCSLQQSVVAVYAFTNDPVIIQLSEIKNIGIYNGPFSDDIFGVLDLFLCIYFIGVIILSSKTTHFRALIQMVL